MLNYKVKMPNTGNVGTITFKISDLDFVKKERIIKAWARKRLLFWGKIK